MKLFLESLDVDLSDIIQISPFIPKKRNQARVEIDKPKEEKTSNEKARVLLNSTVKFFLICAMSRLGYDRIEECEISKVIWNILKTVQEGTY